MMNGEMLRCKNEHVRPRGVIEKNLQVCLITIIVIAMTVFLTSCPNPLPPELVTQINDTDGPVITITEPVARSEYSTVVRVAGTVSDGGGGNGSGGNTAQIAECSYSIPATTIGGTFTLDEEGTFSFLFATREADGTRLVSGPATLEVCSGDWSGNESTASVQLIPAETGDVPGFAVTPGNKKAVISWSEVPGAGSYDLFETKHGVGKSGVTAPYDWTGLENGTLYAFTVTAQMPDDAGDDAVSNIIETVPLSPRSLAP